MTASCVRVRSRPLRAFGSEYAHRPDWGRLQKVFIALFGVVDLPMRIRAREVLCELRKMPCDRVLDVGTGTGAFSFYLTRDPGCQVVAMDIDAKRIETVRAIAKRLRRPGLSTMCGDDEALARLPSNNFSVVLAVEVLQYFPDLKGVFRECHARLRPGGALVAHIPIRKKLWRYEHTLFNDALLQTLCIEAGFEAPVTRQTVGWFSLLLSRIFSKCASRPALLVLAYPLLLLAALATPAFTHRGQSRVVVARKPVRLSAAG
jgi:SAM-dependent methyltransferase